MNVRDLMTTDVATASPATTLDEVAAMMKDEDTGAIPVVREDKLVGIITDRDIVVRCIAEGKDPGETTAEDALSDKLETIAPDADIREAGRIMARKQIRRLPVVEGEELVGILSLGDISVKCDEEIAGETLEKVSRGVKQSEARDTGTGNRNQASAADLRELEDEAPAGDEGLHEERDEEVEAREGRMQGQQGGSRSGRTTPARLKQSANAMKGKQAITNRASRQEQSRQQKVAPIRAANVAAKRGRGKKTA